MGSVSPRVALIVVGDGRLHYLKEAMDSLRENVDYPWVAQIMVNDSGDSRVHDTLRARYPEFTLVSHQRRRGTIKAVQSGWRAALRTRCTHVFHTEEDFTYNEPVEIDRMVSLLLAHPNLAQVVLKRNPYSWPEIEAGGYMELNPDQYEDRDSEVGPWVDHRRLFSSNPSVVPRHIMRLGFNSEALFGKKCIKAGYTFAYWGRTTDPPRVTHIGQERSVGWRDR